MRPSQQVAGLSVLQCHALDQAVAAERLEGWRPTREDLDVLVAECRGADILDVVRDGCGSDGRVRESWWRASRRPYVMQGTSVLRNLLGIVDGAELHRAESLLTAIRLVRCHTGRAGLLEGDGVHRLLPLHRYIFQDVYQWAGRIRTVDLSKNGHSFTRTSAIWEVLITVHEFMTAAPWPTADRGELAYLLSRTYAELNQAHPFREGNGRTATALLHLLVEPTAFRLDLLDIDRCEWIDASRDSAPFRQAGTPSPRPFLPLFLRALVPREV